MPPSLKESLIDCVDDSKPSDEVTANAMGTYKELFGRAEDLDPSKDEYAWSGIIGMVSKEYSSMSCADSTSARLRTRSHSSANCQASRISGLPPGSTVMVSLIALP